MMKKAILVALVVVSAVTLVPRVRSAHASPSMTIRATDLTNDLLNKVMSGKMGDVTVEFKSGDRLPVVFTAEGDLLETAESAPSYWNVKRDFYLRVVDQNQVLMSLDGQTFKPFNQVISGSLSAGATADSSNPVANAINVSFKALLK